MLDQFFITSLEPTIEEDDQQVGFLPLKNFNNLDRCLSGFSFLTPEWTSDSPTPITRQLEFSSEYKVFDSSH